jgi:[CysO sulfur-carrier protein]-S-L-cysteine hydrolase
VVTERLRLGPGIGQALLEHARAELPNEACALLGGHLDDGRATSLHVARNADRSPLRYTVDSDDLVRIVFGLEDSGEDLVAIFHSHTHTPAVPSATDLRSAQYPDAYYVLASLTDPDAAPADALRAWRIERGVSREVELEVD